MICVSCGAETAIIPASTPLLNGRPSVSTVFSRIGRVVINSTLGILGVFDIATEMGLEKHDEDLGQTLGAWGVGEGPYFVLPIFGPSTVRDAAAKPVDLVVNGGWIQGTMAQEASVAGVKLVHTRANLLAADRVLDEGALDRYTYVREAFLQRRRYEVFDGRPPRRDDDYYSALTPGLVAEASTVEPTRDYGDGPSAMLKDFIARARELN